MSTGSDASTRIEYIYISCTPSLILVSRGASLHPFGGAPPPCAPAAPVLALVHTTDSALDPLRLAPLPCHGAASECALLAGRRSGPRLALPPPASARAPPRVLGTPWLVACLRAVATSQPSRVVLRAWPLGLLARLVCASYARPCGCRAAKTLAEPPAQGAGSPSQRARARVHVGRCGV